MNNAELLIITILRMSVPRDIQPQYRFIVRSVKIKITMKTGFEDSLSSQNHLISEI